MAKQEYESAPRGYESTRTHSRISLCLEISGLSVEATLRTVAYVPPMAHIRVLGGFSVDLRSQGRSPKDTTLLPSSLLLLTFYFLLLPFPRVDRRPAHNQAVCQRADSAVSRRTAAYYIIIPRGCALHATDVVISHTFPIARNQARRSLRRRDRSRLSPRAHTSSPRLLPRRRHGQEQVRQPARRRASNRFRASKPDSPPTEG